MNGTNDDRAFVHAGRERRAEILRTEDAMKANWKAYDGDGKLIATSDGIDPATRLSVALAEIAEQLACIAPALHGTIIRLVTEECLRDGDPGIELVPGERFHVLKAHGYEYRIVRAGEALRVGPDEERPVLVDSGILE